jgi:hypothetical protein
VLILVALGQAGQVWFVAGLQLFDSATAFAFATFNQRGKGSRFPIKLG